MKNDHKIYKYVNKINHKVYIGRTCQTLEKRAGSNGVGYKSCFKFWNAIQKYGWDNFVPTILEEGLTDEEASTKELEYISKYDSAKSGYNIIDSLRSNYGDDKRRSLSKAVSNSMTNEHREFLRKLHTGKKMSENSRTKMSIAKRGKKRKPRTEETKIKIRQAHLGKLVSEKTRIKQSLARIGKEPWNKGQKMSDIFKKKCSANNKGKVISDDIKLKISTTFKNRGINVGPKNPMSKKVICIETGIIYDTMTAAAKDANVSVSKVSKCVNGGFITGHYHWKNI